MATIPLCFDFFLKWGLLVVLACVAGVRKGRGRELGRETTSEGGREVPVLSPSRAQILPSTSPFNACQAGYRSLFFQYRVDILQVNFQLVRPALQYILFAEFNMSTFFVLIQLYSLVHFKYHSRHVKISQGFPLRRTV